MIQSITHMKKKRWSLFFLVLPLELVVIMITYVPLFGWSLSFFEYHPGTPLFKNEYVGIKYFMSLFSSREVIRAFVNTVIFSGIRFGFLFCPMLFAILLNEIKCNGYRKIIQTLTTLPYFISWIIVYSLAFALFSTEGFLTKSFRMKISLLNRTDAVYWFQSLVSIWKNLGWDAIIYIAAIAGIPLELYEAAEVDGANKLHTAIYITIPELMNTFLVLMLLYIASFVNNGMDQYYAFSNSIILDKIETLELYTYRVGLQQSDYSFATAAGIIKSMISIVLLFGTNAIAKKIRGTSII